MRILKSFAEQRH